MGIGMGSAKGMITVPGKEEWQESVEFWGCAGLENLYILAVVVVILLL